MPKAGNTLPQTIHDELQCTVALRAYDHVCALDSMKMKEQCTIMHDYYHGRENDCPSQIKMLVEGQGEYQALYHQEHIVVTSTEANKENVLMKLNPMLCCSSKNLFEGGGNKTTINISVQSRKQFNSTKLVSGHNLYYCALMGLKKYRKATSYALDFVDKEGNPSKGDNYDEDELEEEEEEEKTNADTSKQSSLDTNLVPPEWFFPGWMVFVLWGPLVPSSDRLKAFVTKEDSKSAWIAGRQKKREEVLAINNKKRQQSMDVRGLTMDERMNLAMIEM
eukprot:4023705-Ditylum_brightwellii.AAC.1